MGSNYTRGARAEYLAARHLERVGYFVLRSAGSHGPVDLVAVGPAGVRLIQVKRTGNGYISNTELEEARDLLRSVPCPAGVTRELWVWDAGQKEWVRQEVIL